MAAEQMPPAPEPTDDEKAAAVARGIVTMLQGYDMLGTVGLAALNRAASMIIGSMSAADRMAHTSAFKRDLDANVREVLDHIEKATGKPQLIIPETPGLVH